jgi:hypothetical protein
MPLKCSYSKTQYLTTHDQLESLKKKKKKEMKNKVIPASEQQTPPSNKQTLRKSARCSTI